MSEVEKMKVQQIPLDALVNFHNHPFCVPNENDREIQALAESIRVNGVLTTAIAQPTQDGHYELISGHRRKLACKAVGLATMPVVVKEYANEYEAVLELINANLHRKKMLPSEKAKVYTLRYEVLKHQGKATAEKNGEEISGDSLSLIGKATGERPKTIQRYISLSRLIPELLNMVDEGKLATVCGVEISSMPGEAQEKILTVVKSQKKRLTLPEVKKLKKMVQEGSVEGSVIEDALKESLTSPEDSSSKGITLSANELKKYFGEEISEEEIKSRILRLLEKELEDTMTRTENKLKE